MESDDNWLRVGHYDPGFVTGVQQSIEDLRLLATNWDGYGAPAIDPKVIDSAKRFIANLPSNLAFRPMVVPMSRGRLQLEWHEGSKSLELEFESPQAIRFLQWHPDQGIVEEDAISVKDIDRAADLIHWFFCQDRRSGTLRK